MNRRFLTLGVAAAVLAATTGCSTTGVTKEPDAAYGTVAANPFMAANRAAITAVMAGIEAKYRGEAPVLVATVVNINNVTVASPMGRTLSEQYASFMVDGGFNVKEMKLRESIFIREETGELMLSREVKEIARVNRAALVLVGTYSVADSVTFVNLKVVRTEDGRIMTGHTYVLPNDRDVRKLLLGYR